MGMTSNCLATVGVIIFGLATARYIIRIRICVCAHLREEKSTSMENTLHILHKFNVAFGYTISKG